MLNSLKYEKELDRLRVDHQEIEEKIEKEMGRKIINQFGVRDLKKKKLALKEQITVLEDILNGDIVA